MWGQCDRAVSPDDWLNTFAGALVADPTALMKCRLECYDTDPPDLDKRRVSKPVVLGWDGEQFLGRAT